jgi:hypothetical protein
MCKYQYGEKIKTMYDDKSVGSIVELNKILVIFTNKILQKSIYIWNSILSEQKKGRTSEMK